ncbi:hypothetical protein [Chitinophaga sp.]|uniref:hypothetical protein n=1 Tax=Chitinophaga sp. TaxID=1869181 RepID=UPI0031D86867
MHLREEILKENSRAQTLRIAHWVGKDPERTAALAHLFLHDEYRVVQRAAWILSYVASSHPSLLQPHLPQMVARMGDPGIPVAVKRNVVRILQFMTVPEALQGPVMDYCFRFLEDPAETIAVRAFSMTVLANLAQQYPDIRHEIILLIEEQLREGASPGFRSRAKKTLAQLEKLGKKERRH